MGITPSRERRFSYFQQHFWLLTVKYMCVWLPSLGNCIFWETKTLRRKEPTIFFNSVLALDYPRTFSNPVITLFSKTIIMCKVLIYPFPILFPEKGEKFGGILQHFNTRRQGSVPQDVGLPVQCWPQCCITSCKVTGNCSRKRNCKYCLKSYRQILEHSIQKVREFSSNFGKLDQVREFRHDNYLIFNIVLK